MLTASGGPFRGRTADELEGVTREDALRHPTWSMGAKITIDSATMMNKGLELIEAHHLFDLPYDRIEVIVHPQSLVHAMVRLDDGSVLTHCGPPDMRVPIGYALRHPAAPPPGAPMDLVGRTLEFEAPDETAFPCLALAREAGRTGGTAPADPERGERGGGGGLPGRPHRLHGHPAHRRAAPSRPSRPTPADALERVVEADGRARAAAGAAIVAVPA